ncbi:MAG: hypothetical protein WA821_06795 [Anaerolineales bacterium]
MSRKKIDLHKLPVWLQYTIAIVTAAVVMFIAWNVGQSQPAPAWIAALIPFLQWVGVAVLFFVILRALFNKLFKK